RIVLWNVDSLDWQSLRREEIWDRVLPEVVPGSIILQHSAGHKTQDLSGTVEALPEIIRTLRMRGFQFTTVDRLLHLEDQVKFTWHLGERGDTCWALAHRYGIPRERLQHFNPRAVPERLQVGESLRLTEDALPRSYVILARGDTLWHLAAQLGTTVR